MEISLNNGFIIIIALVGIWFAELKNHDSRQMCRCLNTCKLQCLRAGGSFSDSVEIMSLILSCLLYL